MSGPAPFGKGWRGAPGAYVLFLRLPELRGLRVGHLGRFDVEAGDYAYVGSARGGLGARVARHLRAEGKRHWHIDHLTERATLRRAYLLASGEDIECELAEAVRRIGGAEQPIAGFGSSDCRCRSHLFQLDWRASLGLSRLMRSRGAAPVRARRGTNEMLGKRLSRYAYHSPRW